MKMKVEMVSLKIRDYADERGLLMYGYAKLSLGSQVQAGGQSIKNRFLRISLPDGGRFCFNCGIIANYQEVISLIVRLPKTNLLLENWHT